MKVTRKQDPAQFAPVTLTITLETEEEAKALYAVFNHTANARLLGSRKSDSLKEAVGDQFYVSCPGHHIANGVLYRDYYLPMDAPEVGQRLRSALGL